MARKFNKVSPKAFQEFTFGAGVVLSEFNVESPAANYDDTFICDTTGDITVTCVPTYTDMGEDVNNCPPGMMELMVQDGWETRVSFTALNITPETIQLSLGAADIANGKITPRRSLDTAADFRDIWIVCDRMDGKGYAAIHLMNALSTAGLSLTTTDKGKGRLQVELSGHLSIDAQDVVPMEFYVKEIAS